ncbi:MAG: chromosomal replication initiator protein DnaA [Clostridia bacterium]|nr:chromosomal replication initiator protein DnaA [Clostridia bacterium]
MQIESLTDIWEAVCLELKKRMTEIAFNVWFKDLHPIEIRNGEIILGIYSDYKKQIIESNYMNVITPSVREIMGIDMDIKIVVEDENGRIITNKVAEVVTSLNDSYTFDNFIMGSCNRFAHAASMAVADNPRIIYNPLVIYGPSGVGKTHLMLAVKNRIKEKFPEKRVEYVRCEDFTNQLINAIQTGTSDTFRNTYRNLDVLLIDDIQFIAGKEQTQEEFFNTFNALHQDNKQLVFTMDRPPKDVKTLDDRIRNRLEMGLFADITPPDYETRVGIIKKKAESLGIYIEENLVHYIAEHIKMNIRQLEGVVKKLQAFIQIQNHTPTVAVVQNIIREIVNDTKPEPIKIEQIISEVARTYDVSEKDIISKRKTAELAKARQIAMYIARETTELSYKPIGEAFGKDHTTVLYAVKKVESFLKENPHEKEIIDDIIKNLKNET